MRKLVVFPSDPMQAYLDLGQTYEYYSDYFNPGGYFDEVYALSPWGNSYEEVHAKVTYIKSKPKNYRKIIKEISPSVVRGYGGYRCADWLAMSTVDGIPNVLSIHDPSRDFIYDSIRYADNLIYMSNCVKESVRKYINCEEKGEWVMGNRIDTELFSYTPSEEFNESQKRIFGSGRHILHVGRKGVEKNLDTLIKSLKYLPGDVSAIFVGRGNFEPYEKLAIETGVNDRVFNVDHVENIALPKWYSWCDCFCTPSRREGFGFVFIEAASCQTPIVTSNTGAMNEYLINGENAVLVNDYNDPVALADALKYVLDNKSETDRIRKNARKVGEYFSKESVDAQEIAIYEQIINKGPRPRSVMPFFEQKKYEWKYR